MNDAEKLARLAPGIMNAFHMARPPGTGHDRLSMRQYQALIIVHASRSLSVSDLCAKLRIAPSTGTELANRMIKLGYIGKERESKDQRQTLLSVAPPGRKMLQRRRADIVATFSLLLDSLEPQERKSLVACFERIAEILDRGSPDTG